LEALQVSMEMVVTYHDSAYGLQITSQLVVTVQKGQIIGSIAKINGNGCNIP
jgi:hypothetical protein